MGGFFIFRDYALHDAAQLRLHFRKSHAYSDPALLDAEKPFCKCIITSCSPFHLDSC